MEFPHLGKQCSEESCKQLDFLPVKCDACQKIFCNDHFKYDKHNCPESFRKDNQVPVCPLCNTPVAVRKGLAPDLVVGQHIDNDCQQKKKTSNKCNVKGCKQKELIPVVCDKCRKNFCLRHRLEQDHSCAGFEDSGRGISSAGAAAVARTSKPSNKSTTGPFRTSAKPQQTTLSAMGFTLNQERQNRQTQGSQAPSQPAQPANLRSLQAGMSEDEALAQALAMSMAESQPSTPHSTATTPSEAERRQQEEQDMALARALQASEEEGRRQQAPQTQRQSSREKTCRLS